MLFTQNMPNLADNRPTKKGCQFDKQKCNKYLGKFANKFAYCTILKQHSRKNKTKNNG